MKAPTKLSSEAIPIATCGRAAPVEIEVATTFAVQAIELVDHYRFRAVQRAATTAAPLRLKRHSERWAADYFDPASPRFRERKLFVRTTPG